MKKKRAFKGCRYTGFGISIGFYYAIFPNHEIPSDVTFIVTKIVTNEAWTSSLGIFYAITPLDGRVVCFDEKF